MTMPVLLLVSGPPVAGKTTLARRLAAEFGLPLINKDGIKELLFDTVGTHDYAWSQNLGRASIALLQIHCTASADVLEERNERRRHTSERHPGHVQASQRSLRPHIEMGVWSPLHIEGITVIVQTDDLDAIDYNPAYRAARNALGLPND